MSWVSLVLMYTCGQNIQLPITTKKRSLRTSITLCQGHVAKLSAFRSVADGQVKKKPAGILQLSASTDRQSHTTEAKQRSVSEAAGEQGRDAADNKEGIRNDELNTGKHQEGAGDTNRDPYPLSTSSTPPFPLTKQSGTFFQDWVITAT